MVLLNFLEFFFCIYKSNKKIKITNGNNKTLLSEKKKTEMKIMAHKALQLF